MFEAQSKQAIKYKIKEGKTGWRSPSNIAIVKYWGKYGDQLPRNPSISLTLSNAHTETQISYTPAQEKDASISFLFEGKEAPHFKARIVKYLNKIRPIFPFLEVLDLHIESSNSFPHSSGIASSASAMSALAMCLCDMEKQLGGTRENFLRKASNVARLASGSASRSVYGGACIWGALDSVNGSSEEYATPMGDMIDPVFKTFHDDILIVSSERKSVSSSLGHQLMESNPYAQVRYSQAKETCKELLDTMRNGEVLRFGEIAENEALSLHALMMCSTPSFVLMQPGSLEIIKRIWDYRNETKEPIFFTLDAGPNVHVLYPDQIRDQAKKFIQNELISFCENGLIIEDHVGTGPQKLI